MEPRILSKPGLRIAGVRADGQKIAEAWQKLMQASRDTPLTNRRESTGYEVRLYPPQGPVLVYAGYIIEEPVTHPPWDIIELPAALYAEFIIYPARGYTSSNSAMNEWLKDNPLYRQQELNGRKLAVLVYDERYKGETDPASLVACWIPVEKKNI